MTTKERLLGIVDGLSELELDDALWFVEARRAGEWWTQVSEAHAIELNEEAAEQFLSMPWITPGVRSADTSRSSRQRWIMRRQPRALHAVRRNSFRSRRAWP